MTTYIVRRLLLLPVIVFGVTVLIFLMLQFLKPAERSALYVRDIPKNQHQIDAIINRYGLDRPIYEQYWFWLVGRWDSTDQKMVGGILRGDFGYSRTGLQPVSDYIQRRFPATLELALWAVLPIIGVGIWLGVISAVNHNKLIDQLARIYAIIGWSMPSFVVGLLLLMFFYVVMKNWSADWPAPFNSLYFPPGRVSDVFDQVINDPTKFHIYTHLYSIDALLNWRLDIFIDVLRHIIMPVLTLAYIQWALLLKVTRSSMLETLRQEYVVVARAKGLSERTVVYGHALPNALIPVITIGGSSAAGLLAGAVITETIFAYPGMGSAAAQAASQLDVITVLAFVLFNSTILILANLFIDVAYAFVDPRVRLS
jgi:peptide/nickel transport system permease protein